MRIVVCDHRTARLIVVISLMTLLGCTADSDTHLSIDGILQQRASHLADGDRHEITGALIHAEKTTGVDVLLLLAVMEEESHYKPRARSRRGALGLLQVRPVTGRDVAERHGIPWDGRESLFDPPVNILIGATYLREMRARFGTWDLALTAYNQGPTKTSRTARRGHVPSSRYASRVLRRLEALRAELNLDGSSEF